MNESVEEMTRRIAALERIVESMQKALGLTNHPTPRVEFAETRRFTLGDVDPGTIADALRKANIRRGDSVTLDKGDAVDPTLTTDPNDPRLGHGVDDKQQPQNEVYLVLSEEERAKGFVRPVRRSYKHVGLRPRVFHMLTEGGREKWKDYGYVAFGADDNGQPEYYTQRVLESAGCGTVTTMGLALAETYAVNPNFYGATYCCGCSKHLPIGEFVWEGTTERVGS